MLKKADVTDNSDFLEKLYSGSRHKKRKLIKTASLEELQVLAKIVGAVILKKIPVPQSVKEGLQKTRRKTFLKKTFGSAAAVKRVLKQKQGELRHTLLHLVPSVVPILSSLFQP